MRKTQIAALVAGTLLTMNASAIDLLQAYHDAQAYDSQFASARAAREAGAEKSAQGLSGLLPNISLSANVNKIDGTTELNNLPTFNYSSSGYQVQLRQPLFNKASFDTYQQSKLQVTASEVQFEQAKNDLALRVAQAYFDTLTAQDSVNFIQAQKLAISEQLESAKRNFEVGTATITDTYEAQARFDLTQAQEIAALNDLDVKRNALAQVTGKLATELNSLKQGVKLRPPEPASPDQWIQNAESSNFSVVAQRLLVEISRLDISRNRSAHLPTLDAVAVHSDVNNSSPVFLGQLVQNSIGVQFTMPLYAGNLTTSRVRESIALADKASADLDTARRSAIQGTRTAYLGLQSGLSQVKALEAAEISSNSALEANRLGYEVGVRINIDVLNAQQQLYSTRRDLAKARYDTLMAGLRLKAAVGALNESDLAELNALLEAR